MGWGYGNGSWLCILYKWCCTSNLLYCILNLSEVWRIVARRISLWSVLVHSNSYFTRNPIWIFRNVYQLAILKNRQRKISWRETKKIQSNCLRYVMKMNDSRMPKIMLNYRPNGRRRLGEPLKRLLDEVEQVYQGLTRDGWWRWWWKNWHILFVL
jgi:hypothetical protein